MVQELRAAHAALRRTLQSESGAQRPRCSAARLERFLLRPSEPSPRKSVFVPPPVEVLPPTLPVLRSLVETFSVRDPAKLQVPCPKHFPLPKAPHLHGATLPVY
uniref:Uncharacterized protein n=1 Tax=Cyanoptyche gloeocystis TaxID=77922 RepID=A0A7S2JKG2_9EUKA